MFGVTRLHAVVAAAALFGLVAAGGAVATGSEDDGAHGASKDKGALAVLEDVDGNLVGLVYMASRGEGKVLVRAGAQNVQPAGTFHGFHVHETGVCEPPFDSAGDHFHPGSADHGEHAGDLPPLSVAEDGNASTGFVTDRFSVDDLFDHDGSAVVVHAGEDNFANIPDRYHSHTEDVAGPDRETLGAGDAGDRFACGVVRRFDAGDLDDLSLPIELRSVLP